MASRFKIAAPFLVFLTAQAAATPLQPTGQWHLFYEESNCSAERRFGDHILGFQAPPLGKTIRLVVLGPGRATRTRQFDSLIELSDGGPPIRISSLVYGTSKKDLRGITTILPRSEADRVSQSSWLRISTLGTGPKSKKKLPSNEPVFSGEFAVGSSAALARELSKCLADLQKHWGMVGGELPQPAKPPEGKLQGLFRSEDYPEDAMTANQAGSTKFTLMIDEKGKVIDCVIDETSGVASIDGMGCQVITERAKFQPARDIQGTAVKGTYTARVNWAIVDR
jgi:hypothetical protein